MIDKDWQTWRGAVIDSFGQHVYGVTPELTVDLTLQPIDDPDERISRHELIISGERGEHQVELLLCLPEVDRAPVFLGLNFEGNDQVLRQWPIELLLERGYGVATVHAGAFEPDRAAGAAEGVRTILQPGLEDWGTLGVWAWGLSLVRSQLLTLPRTRLSKIIAIGHSRMGKAALWSAAQDEGFAAVISNEAGCSGDSLHRALRQAQDTASTSSARGTTTEDIAEITTRFPYWFTPGYADYAGRDDELPVDQDQLLATIAPRPVAVGSASENDWADPLGQFQAVLSARKLNQGRGPIGFHLRPGEHALLAEDWLHYLTFLDTHLTS